MSTAHPLKSTELSVFVKSFLSKALPALLALALLTSLSCGKRGAPLPPKERVVQRAEISGFQRGDQIVLSWRMPARNAPTGSVQNISRVDVYRIAEPLSTPPALTEAEFAAKSTLVAALPVTDDDFGLKSYTYLDRVQFGGSPTRIRYAIRFVNASGQKAAFSNFLIIEPTTSVAEEPTSLSFDIAQDAITLKWLPPTANVDGSTAVNLRGYNVYRSPSELQPAKLLTQTPVPQPEYRDETFEFGGEYFYFVRAVSSGPGGEPIESGESNIVKAEPRDIFPPSAPTAITLAATPTTISIFFATNPETDVAGYRIYRSNDPAAQDEQWELLTPELLPTNTFQDTRVESGKTYFYTLTAVDKAGNVSERSEVVSETVP